MAAQVLSFETRRQTYTDWTRDELAELYRIEGALVKSGLSLEVDRGVSDEGDPWFVFCRTDGEVLIHLTRYDGLYRLHSPALPRPLIGRTFSDLTKSFADQIPLHVPVQRGKGAKLFVHPSAMLAVVVGTILIASHEVVLAPQASGPETQSADGSESFSGAHLKSLLQSTFQGYLDNFLGWLRDGTAGFQQSAYFNIISTIAAFVVTATAALENHNHDTWAEIAQLIAGDHTPTPDSNQLAPPPHDVGSNSALEARETAHAPNAMTASQIQEQNADTHYPPAMGHKSDGIAAATGTQQPDSSAQQNSEQVNGFAHLLASADSINAAPDQFAASSSLFPANTKIYIDLGTQVAGVFLDNGPATDPLKDLSVALSSLGQNASITSNADVSTLLTHAAYLSPSAEGSQNLLSYVLAQNQLATAASLQVSDAHVVAANAPPPVFDANAASILLAFLKANPNAQAVFDNNSVVVYDGVTGAQAGAVTVQTWEFSDGSTISLVGHTNHSLVA